MKDSLYFLGGNSELVKKAPTKLVHFGKGVFPTFLRNIAWTYMSSALQQHPFSFVQTVWVLESIRGQTLECREVLFGFEDRASGGFRFVQSSDAGIFRGAVEGVRIGGGEGFDFFQCRREFFEGLFGFGFGGLDHHRALDHQREIDCGRVKSPIDEALGHIQCADTGFDLDVLVR